MIPKITGSSDLFCHKYWQKILSKQQTPPKPTQVTDLFGLSDCNEFLTGANSINPTQVAQRIKILDTEFKQLKPTDTPLILYRAIPAPGDRAPKVRAKLYEKAKNLQYGETIAMREYAYADSNPSYPQLAFVSEGSIFYKIAVPQGAQLSKSLMYYNFPRHSVFRCTDSKVIDMGDFKYFQKDLEYILPNSNPSKAATIKYNVGKGISIDLPILQYLNMEGEMIDAKRLNAALSTSNPTTIVLTFLDIFQKFVNKTDVKELTSEDNLLLLRKLVQCNPLLFDKRLDFAQNIIETNFPLIPTKKEYFDEIIQQLIKTLKQKTLSENKIIQ